MSGLREQIIELHLKNLATRSIKVQLGEQVWIRTIQKVIKRYKDTGETQKRPIPRHPRSIRTQETVKIIRAGIRRNPERSLRKIPAEVGISKT